MLRFVFVLFCFFFSPFAGVCHDFKDSFTHFQLDRSVHLSLSNCTKGEVGGEFFLKPTPHNLLKLERQTASVDWNLCSNPRNKSDASLHTGVTHSPVSKNSFGSI